MAIRLRPKRRLLDFCLAKLAIPPAGAKRDINKERTNDQTRSAGAREDINQGRSGHVNITLGTADRILTMNGLRGNY